MFLKYLKPNFAASMKNVLIVKKVKLAALLMFAGLVCQAQTVLKGRVLEAGSEEELIGASIILKGSSYGCITSMDGSFSLQLSEGESIMEVSYLGCLDFEFTAELKSGKLAIKNYSSGKGKLTEDKGFLTIYLTPDTEFLDGSVVTGRKNLESLQALQNERRLSSFAVENLGSKEMSLKGLSDAKESVAKLSGISFADAGQLLSLIHI